MDVPRTWSGVADAQALAPWAGERWRSWCWVARGSARCWGWRRIASAGWLVAAAVVAAFFVFLPCICATAIAGPVPYGAPDLLEGRTSCRFVHGSAVPELGTLDGEETGHVLQLSGALLAGAAVLLVRRRRSGGHHETDPTP